MYFGNVRKTTQKLIMEAKILSAEELSELNNKHGDLWTEEDKQNYLATANNLSETGVFDLASLGKYNELRDFLEFAADEE